jgi:quercetin dioxygenase-like cupin family protein
MGVVFGNFNELKWMDRYTADGKYRGRKKLFSGEGATVQSMEFCNGHPIGPHRHSYEQIAMILQGVCDFYCDGVKYRMSAGDFLVIPPNSEHYIHVHDSAVPVINFDIFIPRRDQYVNEYMEFLKKEEGK